ncbi:hypothetical protein BGZ70_010188 [Mortierella alpina]|uniref:N-acetyltransferase domain-containing protein n=1 Tax=Mortierella alpina TaxID=64518 RepID=A0A9P6IZL3_MORAP|nr:hypothetical protein BGZ70_010188 [Mortierella alpina]
MTNLSETTPLAPPTRDSTITLREITKENWRAITDLRVAASQTTIVASNLKSLCESHYSEDAWARGIYADETPVGFLMMSLWEPEDWYAVWRFMIDEKYQGLGYGRKSMLLAIAHVKETYADAKQIRLMSIGPEGRKDVSAKDSPYNFYLGLGFKPEGEFTEDGEKDMVLELERS